MHSTSPSQGYAQDCIVSPDLLQSKQTFSRTQIVIHKLTIIAALDLLPLLAWHHGTVQFFEDYGMPKYWKDEMGQIQLSGLKTWLWAALWILVGCAYHYYRKSNLTTASECAEG
jgi:hypothetical protein